MGGSPASLPLRAAVSPARGVTISAVEGQIDIVAGRPDWGRLLAAEATSAVERALARQDEDNQAMEGIIDVGVFACGPQAMAKQLAKACRQNSVEAEGLLEAVLARCGLRCDEPQADDGDMPTALAPGETTGPVAVSGSHDQPSSLQSKRPAGQAGKRRVSRRASSTRLVTANPMSVARGEERPESDTQPGLGVRFTFIKESFW
jgi:hypothetical protein